MGNRKRRASRELEVVKGLSGTLTTADLQWIAAGSQPNTEVEWSVSVVKNDRGGSDQITLRMSVPESTGEE